MSSVRAESSALDTGQLDADQGAARADAVQ